MLLSGQQRMFFCVRATATHIVVKCLYRVDVARSLWPIQPVESRKILGRGGHCRGEGGGLRGCCDWRVWECGLRDCGFNTASSRTLL